MQTHAKKEKKNCLKDVLLIHGEFDQGTISSISKLDFPKDIDTICFNSPGGKNDIAQTIMSIIKKKEINTCLAEEYNIKGMGSMSGTHCESACPLILLMGKKRFVIGEKIKIGIHHSGKILDFCFTCLFIDSDGDDFSPYFTDEGHIKLFQRSRKTSLKDMDFLRQDEWKEYNIFTNYLEQPTGSNNEAYSENRK
ncbi:hypothetical protein [Aeromonas jandaei]|uniref:hypothetical protein n=1 Tax=Aeromonas jandaei TaxID=650 RepID=UPI003BA27734